MTKENKNDGNQYNYGIVLQLLPSWPSYVVHHFGVRFHNIGSNCMKHDTFLLCCTGGRIRTHDQWFWRPLLYQLSYTRLTRGGTRPPLANFINNSYYYAIISVTWPAPTVLPPSRIAKRSPLSIATGTINLTLIVTLSPGITISTPSGNIISPVTSVVRK